MGRVFGIDGEGDDADVGQASDLLVDALHFGTHHGAGGGASGVDEIGDPDFAEQGGALEEETCGVGHGERRDFVVFREIGGRVSAGGEEEETEGRVHSETAKGDRKKGDTPCG